MSLNFTIDRPPGLPGLPWTAWMRVLVLLFSIAAMPLPGGAQELSYTLGAGDRIRVTVFGQEDLSGEFEVDGNGRVSLPLIRDVQAVGLTLQELEVRITGKLKPDYLKNPHVSIEVLNYRPFYIIGEVKTQRRHPVRLQSLPRA